MFLSVVLPFSSRFWLLAFCFGCFCAEETETTKTKHEQPKPRREWQYNAEKHKGKASASRVGCGLRKAKHACSLFHLAFYVHL